MPPVQVPTAAALRERFRAIPQGERDAHQAFSIRVWRVLSWLERSDAVAEAEDLESRFIFLWIAFNALYGRLGSGGKVAGDRGSWQALIAQVIQHDGRDALGRLLKELQGDVLSLVDCEFLFKPFWMGRSGVDRGLRRARRRVLRAYTEPRGTVIILQEVFERLYVLRQQVFHGAATAGSRLNRQTLARGTALLAALVPQMLAVVIEAGPGVDWGPICYPPRGETPAAAPPVDP